MIIKNAGTAVLTCITVLFFMAISSTACPAAEAATGTRGNLLFNSGWSYIAHPANQPDELPGEGWSAVELPHTWNATDPVDTVPGYRRGVGWYRKTVSFDSTRENVRRLLRFEAANMKATVFVNGRHAGGHVGGYLGFTVEIGPWLEDGIENEILVRVDNGVDRNLIPSQKSDFVLYGGITRDVYLQSRPETFISRIRIDTPSVSAGSATAVVTANIDGTAADARVRFRLIAPGGEVLATTEPVEVSGETATLELPPVCLLYTSPSPRDS